MKSRGRAKSVPVFLYIFKIIGNFNEKAIKIFLILKKTAKSIIIYYICIFRDFGGCFMLHTSILKLQAVTSELSMSEKFISSAKVILTGFAVVFAMLFLLILIIKLYSAIIAGAQNAADKKKKKQKVVEAVSGDGGVHIVLGQTRGSLFLGIALLREEVDYILRSDVKVLRCIAQFYLFCHMLQYLQLS